MKDITVVIYDKGEAEWVSCQVIKENLLACYKKNNIVEINLSTKTSNCEILAIYREIIEIQPKRIVFLDGVPHPYKLVQLLSTSDFKTSPELIFHIYGDFTIKTHLWKKIETKIQSYKCLFLCASQKQVSLVKKLIKSPELLVAKCPFAVDENSFSNDPGLRKETRSFLGHNDDEFILIYTGRLSEQKNIHRLIHYFNYLVSTFNINAHLYLVGDFDDLATPFIGKYSPDFFYFHYISDLIENTSKKVRQSIHLTGKQGRKELQALYNAADLFISFSVHNDEDFGMSPIEALCTGLPAIITDWGGYSGFESDYCELISTKIESEHININISSAVKKTLKYLNEKPQRQEVADFYHNKFGIESIQRELWKNLRATKFCGFTKDFDQVMAAFKDTPRSPFLAPSPISSTYLYNNLYKRLYSSYES